MTLKSFLISTGLAILAYGCPQSDDDGAATGEACTAASDCGSGLCHPGGYCTEECAGSCSSGFECVDARIGNEQTGICERTSGGGSDAGAGGAGGGAGGAGGFGGGAGGAGGGAGGAGGGAGGAGGGAGGAGGGAGGAGGGGGALDCPGIVECLNGCGQDQVCAQDCVDQGDPQAQQLINDALACLQANGGDQEACQTEIEACVGAGPQPMGDLTCSELNGCLSNCAEGDQACVNDCFGQASAEGAALFEAAVTCIQANGEEACAEEIDACLGGGGPGGDLTCGGIFDCAGQCPDGDQNCIQGCLGAGTAAAQDQAIELSQCAQEADANGQDVETACAELIEACFGPPAPPGTDACGAVLDCLVAAQDEGAAQACYEGGTENARALIETAVTCLNDNQCMDVECAECSNEVSACRADR